MTLILMQTLSGKWQRHKGVKHPMTDSQYKKGIAPLCDADTLFGSVFMQGSQAVDLILKLYLGRCQDARLYLKH